MSALPASLATVAATIERILADRGPMPEPALVRALAESGLDLGAPARDVFDEMMDSAAAPDLVMVGDDLAVVSSLVVGRVFTHRVTEAECEQDVLTLLPDLVVVSALADEHGDVRTADGAPLRVMSVLDGPELGERGDRPPGPDGGQDDEYAVLPRGFLESHAVRPGDLVAVSCTDDGLVLARADAVPPGQAAVLRPWVEAWFDDADREPSGLPRLLWELCASTDAFTAVGPPLGDLLTAWGVDRLGDLVAREGFDFGRWEVEQEVTRVADTYRIDDDDALAVVALRSQVRALSAAIEHLDALDGDELEDALAELAPGEEADDGPTGTEDGPGGIGGGPRAEASTDVPTTDTDTDAEADADAPGTADLAADREVIAELTRSLTDPAVAEAFLAETVGTGDTDPAALGLFAESAQGFAPVAAQPPLRWLVAKAHERRGEVASAEEGLRDAVGTGPFVPALHDLARYEADRGNALGALDLLRRAGVGRDDPEVALLTRMTELATRDLGRNKPCWCGSGRKYKVCHLGKEEVPLAERAVWLYQKAGAYAQEGVWREDVFAVALERARWARSDSALIEALSDGLVIDAVMVEGGAFEVFLDERGGLLPADERELGEQWLHFERSVHAVEAVVPGATLTLRDVRTGDVREVRERTASRTLTVGTLICTRVLPAGDTWQMFGGLEPVALHERDALVELLDDEPDAPELVAFLSRRLAPPTLATMEGEPLVLHEVEVRLKDTAAVVARLDEAYERPDPVAASWQEHVPGADQVRATLHLVDDVLEVSTNSDERLDRVMSLVRDADPGVEVVGHDRRTAEEMIELTERFPGLGSGDGDDDGDGDVPEIDDPDLADMLSTMIRRYEDEWIDESIPALAGLTPREAVADPTRRDDVVRLLRSFPPPTPQSMSRDRLATMLGIELG